VGHVYDLTDDGSPVKAVKKGFEVQVAPLEVVEVMEVEGEGEERGVDCPEGPAPAASGIVSPKVCNLNYRCPHSTQGSPYLDYRYLCSFKLVSHSAFETMLPAETRSALLDHDFSSDNYRCPQCSEAFSLTREHNVQAMSGYTRILTQLASDDRDLEL